MRIVLVLDETPFFHPTFARDVIEGLNPDDEVVGACLVVEIPLKSNIEAYMRRNIGKLTFGELARIGTRRLAMMALNQAYPRGRNRQYYSTRAALNANGLNPLLVRRSINAPDVLTHIRQMSPDVIVSSNSLIFGKEILSIPKVCCINRHSALLPSYGGIFPVMHAVSRGEKVVGASVQVMTAGIDEGPVLAWREVPVGSRPSLWSLYDACFRVSVDVVHEALERVRVGDLSDRARTSKSYYSFPTDEDWHRFRERGGAFA